MVTVPGGPNQGWAESCGGNVTFMSSIEQFPVSAVVKWCPWLNDASPLCCVTLQSNYWLPISLASSGSQLDALH